MRKKYCKKERERERVSARRYRIPAAGRCKWFPNDENLFSTLCTSSLLPSRLVQPAKLWQFKLVSVIKWPSELFTWKWRFVNRKMCNALFFRIQISFFALLLVSHTGPIGRSNLHFSWMAINFSSENCNSLTLPFAPCETSPLNCGGR